MHNNNDADDGNNDENDDNNHSITDMMLLGHRNSIGTRPDSVRTSREKYWMRQFRTIKPHGLNIQEGNDWIIFSTNYFPPHILYTMSHTVFLPSLSQVHLVYLFYPFTCPSLYLICNMFFLIPHIPQFLFNILFICTCMYTFIHII